MTGGDAMSPEERAESLYRRIVSPRTGEFETTRPSRAEIADAIREAVIEEHNAVVEVMQDQMEDAVAVEREACAKVADELSMKWEGTLAISSALAVAAAIRARGTS